MTTKGLRQTQSKSWNLSVNGGIVNQTKMPRAKTHFYLSKELFKGIFQQEKNLADR